MKKIVLTLVAALVVSVNVFAYDGGKKSDDGSKVSYLVKNQFDAEFGAVDNIVWTVTPDFQKAEFLMDDLETSAYYNLNGDYLGYTQHVTFKVLPTAAKKAIAKKYQGYNVVEVIKFQPEGSTSSSLERLTIGSSSTEAAYFVNLKKDDQEVLVRATPFSSSLEVVKN